ncbi:HIT family protein [Streptomyces sp. V4-01]|uniref:HIT family protein n=1 Tax=Actinacidiphila polyblastidii TaxID=3110430 RepID=A0ABU7PL59_9ACTN|nr:HIT family protein [Streptomyces sp. V4-01]
MAQDVAGGCYACGREALFGGLPARECVDYDAHWRVAHDFNSALAGWLVLLPRRHVTALHELTDAEAAALGGWQVRLSRALRAVTGCAKTYVVQFAEAEGFAHVHFHVVPRQAELAPEYHGPGVFGLLRRPAVERLTTQDADRVALAVRAELRAG